MKGKQKMSKRRAFCPGLDSSTLESKVLMSGGFGGGSSTTPVISQSVAGVDVTEPTLVSRSGTVFTFNEVTTGLSHTPGSTALLRIDVTLTDADTGLTLQQSSTLFNVSGTGPTTTQFSVNFGNLPPGDYAATVTAVDGSGQNPYGLSTFVDFEVPPFSPPSGGIVV